MGWNTGRVWIGGVFAMTMLTVNVHAQSGNRPLGPFESQSDIGAVKRPGSATYDAERQTLTIAGAGTNMWFGQDEFHFVYRKIRGDFIVTARAQFVGLGVEMHRKFGWQARATLDGNSPQATAVVHGDGLTSLQFRRTPGSTTEEQRSAIKAPDVIQLERRGNRFILSAAHWGEPFAPQLVQELDLPDELYVGLFVCSHNPDVLEKAIFENIRVTIPAPATLVPYHDFLGSRLELLDVATGRRTVVHETDGNLEAPNWTPDGKTLIYNSMGRLFSFDLASGKTAPLDTGSCNHLNNDHVLSFDGKMLGISNNETGGSIIYTLPSSGGAPKKITPTGPSYLHGWSPDGKSLIYTANRGGDFDIYKIASDGSGTEQRLTTAPGLDDGSEFTPDGKHIFFCSTRSGWMQIWKMDADGSHQEQVTQDAYNNWFPHVSPDGSTLVFISYGTDVKPADHPYYKHVYLRSMPATGGQPKTIAYVYGGQGTINVPSWSPDGKYVAFVSNTGK